MGEVNDAFRRQREAAQEHRALVVTGSVFYGLDTLIDHAGRVSTLLFPTLPTANLRRKHRIAKARGEHLRRVPGVADTDVISSRDLRNNLQHFDERLDNWANETTAPAAYQDVVIGVPSSVVDQAKVIRRLNLADGCYYFRGTRFRVQDIINFLSEIGKKIGPLLAEHEGLAGNQFIYNLTVLPGEGP
jgi:hypothetical protein